MSAVEKEAKEPENGDKENGENEEDRQSGNFLDPKKADASAQLEFQKKYGFSKKPSAVAQRKLSQGGKQYFDSGDYNMQESRKDRQEIASYPHAVNPHLTQLIGKSSGARPLPMSHPSKLAGGIPPGRLEGGIPPGRLAGGIPPGRLAGSTQPRPVQPRPVQPRLAQPSRLAGSTQPSRLASSTQSPLAQ